jgi:hypothetical protein
MRIVRRRLFKTDSPEAVESSQAEDTRRKDDGPPKKVKFSFLIKHGLRQPFPIREAWYVPGTQQTIVVCQLPVDVGGEWIVAHLGTNYIILSAPSKAYAFRLMELILPRCNLPLWIRGFWDGVKEAMGETVHGYLHHVWRAGYEIGELPTVKQWLKSGLKNSHKKFNPCHGKMTVKKRKRKEFQGR